MFLPCVSGVYRLWQRVWASVFKSASPFWLGLCLLMVLSVGWLVGAQSAVPAAAAQPGDGYSLASFPPYSDRWRIGYGCAREHGYVTDYDISQLCAGWYHDWGTWLQPPRPDGIEFVQHVRVGEKHFDLANPDAYSWATLQARVQANPGAVWVIGNEPDGRSPTACDSRYPHEYAQIYKRFYDFIKGVDPTARVAIGSIIQGTPLRMQWLTLTWNAYKNLYGVDMPVDVWTMHNQMVTEAPSQGADIPLGTDPALARVIGEQDNDNLNYFIEYVARMRQWMKDHGQQNKPLYITEYGVLQPEYLGFTSDRINQFMNSTFTWMFHAKDSNLGLPEDDYRLVQRWNWFALNVPHGSLGQGGWNGSLFDLDTGELSEIGLNFSRWACSAVHPTPTPNTTPLPDPIVREAEHGTTYGKMARKTDNSVSACRYVTVDPNAPDAGGASEVLLSVYIPNSGNYAVWGRAKGIDYNNRSFSLRVGAYAWEAWYFGVGGWNWQKLPASGGYDLARGWHTIRIGGRGGGLAQLDMILVTSNLSYNPNNHPSLIQICNPTPTPSPTASATPQPSPTPTVTRTPMPEGPGRIAGQVAFQGAGTPPAESWARPLLVSAHLPGDPIPAYEFAANADELGEFLMPSGVLTGTYDVGVRDMHSLRNLWRNVEIHENTGALDMGTLLAGDANGDNSIDILDFSLLASHYGTSRGQPGYNSRPDFNNDGTIGILDFSLLATNYGKSGNQVLNPGLSGAAVLSSSGNVTIYVSPSSKTAQPNEVFAADVYMNAGSNEVNAVECHMTFNPAYLRVESISPDTSGLNQVLVSSYDNGGGTVSYEAGRLTTPPSSKTGTFRLFTLQIRALTSVSSTTLGFGNVVASAPGAVTHTVSKQSMTVSIPPATATPTPTNTLVATAVPSPTATNTPGVGVQELVLQQGRDGYDGFEDTTLDAWNPDTSQHTDQHLRLRSPDVRRILLRADVGALPPGAWIEEATLTLYQGSGGGSSMSTSVYGLLRPWVHGQATWNRASAALLWAQPGCGAAGSDRDAASVAERPIWPTAGGYADYPFDWDVTALVQRWVDDPGANHGLLIEGSAGTALEFLFRSADYPDVAVRPRLVIRYRTEGPTPTPSVTATITQEPTPGPTSTPTVTASATATMTPSPSSKGAVSVLAIEERRGEAVVPGVMVELQDLQGSGYREVRATNAQGRCLFGDLIPGAYRVTVIQVPWPHRMVDDAPHYVTVEAGSTLQIDISLRRIGILALPLIWQSQP
jgi:hypothetical protein